MAPRGDTRDSSVAIVAVEMPYPRPLPCSLIADCVYDFCSRPDPYLGISVLVCDV